MVYTTHLWWWGGWFIISIPTLWQLLTLFLGLKEWSWFLVESHRKCIQVPCRWLMDPCLWTIDLACFFGGGNILYYKRILRNFQNGYARPKPDFTAAKEWRSVGLHLCNCSFASTKDLAIEAAIASKMIGEKQVKHYINVWEKYQVNGCSIFWEVNTVYIHTHIYTYTYHICLNAGGQVHEWWLMCCGSFKMILNIELL